MNKKIKEFAINSQLVSNHNGKLLSGWREDVDLTEYLEDFAKLIVKECADFADEHNDASEGVTLGVGRALKNHFGVEE